MIAPDDFHTSTAEDRIILSQKNKKIILHKKRERSLPDILQAYKAQTFTLEDHKTRTVFTNLY